MCEDVDECEELGPDVCFNGVCINIPGAYECECSPGYILDNTGHICMGIRFLLGRSAPYSIFSIKFL